MIIRLLFVLVLTGSITTAFSQADLITRFEASGGMETPTYQESIAWWQGLDQAYEEVKMLEMGPTDSGFPLHLILVSTNKEFDLEKLREKKVILINNGIHAGEPDGIDASMMFVRDLLKDKAGRKKLENTVLAIIPIYNIGGALNRSSSSRVNQSGPEEYGFRGNARNFDLNRDYIKNDTRNAQSFAQIFHLVQPDVFLETHVSNGADYQYIMTALPTQHSKLGGVLGDYLENQMMPKLDAGMMAEKFEMTPYVNVHNSSPDKGWSQFVDWPRYSTGYTTLFHTIGFMTETHMLKPYDVRVKATYAFMGQLLNVVNQDGAKIKSIKKQTQESVKTQTEFALNWKNNKEKYKTLQFKGYEASYIPSKVTGQDRLFFDRSKPYQKEVKFYNHFDASVSVAKPKAYIIPQGWFNIVDRLKLNQVQMIAIAKDTIMELAVYYIDGFETYESPFEGHYVHYNTQLRKEIKSIRLRKGDWIVYTNQVANRYLLETLEPQAPDSFFNWNFFDTILQQKEGYSEYVFEDLAWEILQQNSDLKKAFEDKKLSDTTFAADAEAKLDYIYQNSPYYESAHLRYPIFRLE